MLPSAVHGTSRGYEWTAHLDFGGAGPDVPYVPGSTLRWLITLDGEAGPAVQYIGPATAEIALRQLAHIVDAWLASHPPNGSTS